MFRAARRRRCRGTSSRNANAGYSFNQLVVDPNNPDRIWITGSSFNGSADGGKTWGGRGGLRLFGRAFGDFRSLWVDPEDSDHMIATSDGGVFQSFAGGKVQLTRNGGTNWTDVTKNIAAAGGQEDVWVSRVYASRFAEGTAYVAKTGRRQDIFKPYLFKTTDFGATWKSISSNVPQWPVNSIVEDLQKASVLFAGTDISVYASIDGGARWVALKSNMPPAPVTDMVIHPREQDLVAGTYGRGIWVVDIAPIREMTEENLGKCVYLFAVKPKPIRRDGAQGNYRLLGDTFPSTPNESNGLLIYYYLKQDAAQPVSITIADQAGNVVRTLPGSQKAGINRVSSEGGGFGGGRGGGARATMPPGDYVVTLQVGETKLTQKARLLPTPDFR